MTEHKTKKLSELCQADLGKKVRYAFDEESVLVGTLESVAHYLNGATYVTVGDTKQHSKDPEATIDFV